MNIILATNAYHPIVGGVENVVRYLSREFRSHGHNVAVFTSRNPFSLPAFEKIEGVPVYRAPMYVYRDSVKSAIAERIGMPVAIRQLKRLVNDLSPCLVHVHFVYHNAVCVNRIRSFLKRQGVPIVVTFHGGDAPVIPEEYRARQPSECQLLDKTAFELLEHADALTAVSDGLRKDIVAATSSYDRCIQVLHNGVDCGQFRPLNANRNSRLLLASGRLCYQKGFDILLRAFAIVHEECPQLKLAIAGEGELREELIDLTRHLGLSDVVSYLGVLPAPQLVEQMNRAEIVISAARWEGFSLAALEAMACGRPYVTTDVQGVQEMLESGVDGSVVPKEDPVALANAILDLMKKPLLRRSMGKAARQKVNTEFNWSTAAEKYLEMYETLIERVEEDTTPKRTSYE